MTDAPSNKIYRGLRLNDIPEELQAIIKDSLGLPMDESEVGKHFRLGPALLDHIESNHWEKDDPYYAEHGLETANMGRNWTTNRDFAEKAGSPNTGPCQYGVLLEAELPTNPYAFDPANNGEYGGNMRAEQQVTPVPGAPLNVTGVKIRDGQEWREVLNDPDYVARRSKDYPSILQHHTGPQIRLAMTTADDYAMERWREGSKYFFAYSPPTYTYRGPKTRPVTPQAPGYDSGSDFNFTGSPETQYHHRNITPETLKGIEKRENSVDDYYAEMAQRRDSGLEPIPWNEWLNRVSFIRDAMPTYYHHTREPDFKIDPDRKPDNAVLNRKLPNNGKGLWVSPDKDHWRNYHYQGRRPYLVELYSEEDLGDDPSELFVGGDQLKNMQVRSVEKKAHRTAMPITHIPPMNHFDENLFLRQLHNLVYSDDEIAGKPDRANIIRTQYGNAGKSHKKDYGHLISLIHHDENGAPNGILHYFPHGSYGAGEKPGGIQVLVHPAHQGKGVGTKLMETALAEFGKDAPEAAEKKRRYDYEPIDLENQQYTPAGFDLYKRVRQKKRVAMAWEDWADKIKGGCKLDGCYFDGTEGRYVIPQAGAFLDYSHRGTEDNPKLFVSGIYTHPDNRNDGVAEALMRKLVEDHPGIPIDPGYMTQDGQKFHDQMLEKEPDARQLVTANSLLVGPDDAYDETDWFSRHYQHPASQGVPPNSDWYHVSPHMMPEGTILQPMRGETPWNDDPYDHGLQNRANWIWVEYDKDKAKAWMHWVLQHQPNCYIYRVKPRLGPFAWNGTADEGWVTDRAEIVEFLDQISHDLEFQEKP